MNANDFFIIDINDANGESPYVIWCLILPTAICLEDFFFKIMCHFSRVNADVCPPINILSASLKALVFGMEIML